jgi:hypothetical protein
MNEMFTQIPNLFIIFPKLDLEGPVQKTKKYLDYGTLCLTFRLM